VPYIAAAVTFGTGLGHLWPEIVELVSFSWEPLQR